MTYLGSNPQLGEKLDNDVVAPAINQDLLVGNGLFRVLLLSQSSIKILRRSGVLAEVSTVGVRACNFGRIYLAWLVLRTYHAGCQHLLHADLPYALAP